MALELLNRDDVQNPHYIASTYNPAAPLEVIDRREGTFQTN